MNAVKVGEQTELENEREINKPPNEDVTVEKDYTDAGEAKLKAESSTNGTPQGRKRKRITKNVMDHQTKYNKYMV